MAHDQLIAVNVKGETFACDNQVSKVNYLAGMHVTEIAGGWNYLVALTIDKDAHWCQVK